MSEEKSGFIPKLGRKIRYKCVQVKIFEKSDGTRLCCENKLIHIVNGEEWYMMVTTDAQEFRPGRYYWLEFTEAGQDENKRRD